MVNKRRVLGLVSVFTAASVLGALACGDDSSSAAGTKKPGKEVPSNPDTDGGAGAAGAPGTSTGTGGSDVGGASTALPVITGPAADLARQLTTAANLADAVAATEKVLAKVGVSVIDPTTGDILSDGGGPVGIWPSHVLNLAVEARSEAVRGTITLDRLSDMFADVDDVANTPFTPATTSAEVDGMLAPRPYLLETGSGAGDELVLLLSGWIKAALAHPDDPEAFAPLFLAAMGQAQSPPVDLTNPNLAAEDVRLSLLDLEVMLSGLRADPATVAAASAASAKDTGGSSTISQVRQKAVQPFKPVECDFFPDPVTGLPVPVGPTPPPGETNATPTFGKYVKTGLGVVKDAQSGAKNGFSPSDPNHLSSLKKILDSVLKLVRLAEFYRDAQIDVGVEGEPKQHLPLKTEPDIERKFVAHAGISDKEYQDFKLQYTKVGGWLKDCAEKFGIPTLPDASDLLKEIEKWRINWVVHGNLADISAGQNRIARAGGYETPLTLTAENKGQAELLFTMHHEQPEVKKHEGPKETKPFTVEADLDASQPPSLDAVISGLGGFADAIGGAIDIAVDWTRSLIQPKAFGTLMVEYHHSTGWHGTIRMRQSIGSWRRWRWYEIGGACSESFHSVDRIKLRLTRDYTLLGVPDTVKKPENGGAMLGFSEQECFAQHQVDVNDTGVTNCGEYTDDPANRKQTSETYDVTTQNSSSMSGMLSGGLPAWNVTLLVASLPPGVPLPPNAGQLGLNTYSIVALGANCKSVGGQLYDFTKRDGPEITDIDPVSLPLEIKGLQVMNEPIPEDRHLVGRKTEMTSVDYAGFSSVPLITTYRWDLKQD